MSNFARMFNSDVDSNSRKDLDAAVLEGGKEYVSIEGPAYAYPLGWVCCFRKSDLRPYTLALQDGSGSKIVEFALQIPVATVAQAVENVKASWPRYVALTGDAEVAREYWDMHVEAVKAFRFRYLTLDITELLILQPDVVAAGRAFADALSGDDPAAGSNSIFEYNAGVAPYSLAEVYSKPLGEDADHERKQHNFKVLDWFGRGEPKHWWWHPRRETPRGPRVWSEKRR